MTSAKAARKSADKALSKAHARYELLPTDKNYQRMTDAQRDYKVANSAYKKAKLSYKVAKTEAEGGFDSTKKKSKHQTTLEEKYRQQGYSAKEAEVLARDRIRTERVLTAAAALTVTACAAYATNKYVKNRTDQILKSGTVLQRIEMQNTGGKLHETFYASSGKHDNKRYEGVLGFTRKANEGEAYIMKLQANKDIKVASKEKAVKAFGDLYKSDSQFRESVKDNVSSHFLGKNRIRDVNDLSDRNIRKMYDNFNSGLPLIRESGSGADKKFYDKLKSAGYDAIQDVNDMKYSGYNAKNPLIVFNNTKDNIMVKSVKELTKDDGLGKKAAVELGKGQIENMGQLLASPYTAVATTGAAATMYVSDYTKTNKKKQSQS
jgi:hypothetical protein